jgi:hypothetical protein
MLSFDKLLLMPPLPTPPLTSSFIVCLLIIGIVVVVDDIVAAVGDVVASRICCSLAGLLSWQLAVDFGLPSVVVVVSVVLLSSDKIGLKILLLFTDFSLVVSSDFVDFCE